MFWHPHGDYLAVKVDRYTKTRKTTYTSFELFSVKARDIPMEVYIYILYHAALVFFLQNLLVKLVSQVRRASQLYWGSKF